MHRLNVLLSAFTSAGNIIDVCVVVVAHPWGVSAAKRPVLAWEAPLGGRRHRRGSS
jgi:hypothetical protein